MKSNDFYNFGEEIQKIVQSAIDSNDFRQLNETVRQTVGEAVEAVRSGVSQASEGPESIFGSSSIGGDCRNASDGFGIFDWDLCRYRSGGAADRPVCPGRTAGADDSGGNFAVILYFTDVCRI